MCVEFNDFVSWEQQRKTFAFIHLMLVFIFISISSTRQMMHFVIIYSYMNFIIRQQRCQYKHNCVVSVESVQVLIWLHVQNGEIDTNVNERGAKRNNIRHTTRATSTNCPRIKGIALTIAFIALPELILYKIPSAGHNFATYGAWHLERQTPKRLMNVAKPPTTFYTNASNMQRSICKQQLLHWNRR